MRLPLRIQLIIASFLLVFLSVGSIGFLVLGEMKQTLLDEQRQKGLIVAQYLAGVSGDYLLSGDKLALDMVAKGAKANKGVLYAQILDQKGLIRAAEPESGVESLYYPPAGLENLKPGSDSLIQPYYNGRQWVQDVAVPIKVDGLRAGVVHVGLDENLVDAAIRSARHKIFIAAGGVLLVALILALLLAFAIAYPVERLSTAVKSLGQGALDTRVKVGGPYELQRLEERFNQMASKVESLVHGVIQSLAIALAEHDQVSPGHAERVTRFAVRTARHMKMSAEQVEELRLAGQLIDVGHMGVPSGLLHKSEPLSDDELRKLRMHPQVGARIVEPVSVLKPVIPLLMHHHERFDGRGYPLGLKAEAIPLGARILAVCDSFDAMLTEKRHRRARSQEDAIRELKRCAGAQFDPKVVDAFIAQLSKAS